jgi:hypothetical protein
VGPTGCACQSCWSGDRKKSRKQPRVRAAGEVQKEALEGRPALRGILDALHAAFPELARRRPPKPHGAARAKRRRQHSGGAEPGALAARAAEVPTAAQPPWPAAVAPSPAVPLADGCAPGAASAWPQWQAMDPNQLVAVPLGMLVGHAGGWPLPHAFGQVAPSRQSIGVGNSTAGRQRALGPSGFQGSAAPGLRWPHGSGFWPQPPVLPPGVPPGPPVRPQPKRPAAAGGIDGPGDAKRPRPAASKLSTSSSAAVASTQCREAPSRGRPAGGQPGAPASNMAAADRLRLRLKHGAPAGDAGGALASPGPPNSGGGDCCAAPDNGACGAQQWRQPVGPGGAEDGDRRVTPADAAEAIPHGVAALAASDVEVVFLGTGSAEPSKYRGASAIHIR